MKYTIVYVVAKEKREKVIMADSFEDAEKKANSLFKNWIDILLTDFKRGNEVKMGKMKKESDLNASH